MERRPEGRYVRLFLLCAAALLIGSAANAQSFDNFKSFCLATDAQPDAVQSSVLSAGWTEVDSAMFGDAMSDGDRLMAVYVSPEDEAGIIMVGEGEPPLDLGGEVTAKWCVMATESVSVERARSLLIVELGLGGPIAHEIDDGLWLYSTTDGVIRDERALVGRSAADVRTASLERPLRFTGAGGGPGPVMLVHAQIQAR